MSIHLSPPERRAFKARAHALDPVVLIGDAGLTPAVFTEIDRSLNAHELIKIRVASDNRDARDEILGQVCEHLGAAPVQHIGKILVIYRQKPGGKSKPGSRPKKKPGRPLKRSFQNRV